MAYDTALPPALTSQMFGKNGGSHWTYDSADAATVVRVDGYITNGQLLGMKIGDQVTQIDTTGGTIHHIYSVVSLSSVNDSVDLSDGQAIAVTDTD